MEEPSVARTQTNRVHGSILGSRFAFAEQRYGKAGKQLLIDRLPAKERTMFESAVFENHWFDFGILELIDRAIVERLAAGDEQVLHDLGRFSAEYNYKRLPPQLINQPPDEVLKNASRINVIFQDCGELQYESLPSKGAINRGVIIYRYDQSVPASYCTSALGYFERLLELLGYRVVEVNETQCQSRGNDTHRYEIGWEAERVAEPVMPQRGQTGKLTMPGSNTGSFNAVKSAAAGTSSGAGSSSGNTRSLDASKAREFSARTNGTVVLTREEERERMRIKILLVLIGATTLFGLMQAVYHWATTKKEVVAAKEIIHKYRCNGALQPKQLRYDRPYFLINTPDALENVKAVYEDNGKKYIYTTKKIVPNAVIEFCLGEFFSTEKKAPSLETVPRNFTINATVNGKPKECSCWLDD